MHQSKKFIRNGKVYVGLTDGTIMVYNKKLSKAYAVSRLPVFMQKSNKNNLNMLPI